MKQNKKQTLMEEQKEIMPSTDLMQDDMHESDSQNEMDIAKNKKSEFQTVQMNQSSQNIETQTNQKVPQSNTYQKGENRKRKKRQTESHNYSQMNKKNDHSINERQKKRTKNNKKSIT